MVSLMDLFRGGTTGRGDPYINERSPFAKFPLPPKNAKPLNKKKAVAAAAAAPHALWKAAIPIPRPTGGPGGGIRTGQAPPGGPGGGTFTGQAPIGGPGGGTLTGQPYPGGPGGNTMTGQPYPGGPGGNTMTGQAPLGGPGGGTLTGQAPPGGPGGGTRTGQMLAALLGGPGGNTMTGQAPLSGPGGNTMTGQPGNDLPNASDGADPDAGPWWQGGGPGGNTRTGQPMPPPYPSIHEDQPAGLPSSRRSTGASPQMVNAQSGPFRDRTTHLRPRPSGGLMGILQQLFGGGQ